MIIVLEAIALALAIAAVLALMFRVRCPPDHALVLTYRTPGRSLRSGPPSFRVLADQGVFRTPSVGAIDVLELSPVRFDAFVPIRDAAGACRGEIHTVAQVRVSRRIPHLRRAAVRVLGLSRRELDATGEGALAIAVRDAMAGRAADEVMQDPSVVEADVREELGPWLDELGLELTELHVRFKRRDG